MSIEREIIDELIDVVKHHPEDKAEYEVFHKAKSYDEMAEILSNYLMRKINAKKPATPDAGGK